EEPRPLIVVTEHVCDPSRPARGELGRQPRFERLHGRARLEPGDAVGERHAQHRRPRALVRRLDVAGRFDVLANPVFGGCAVGYGPLTAESEMLSTPYVLQASRARSDMNS